MPTYTELLVTNEPKHLTMLGIELVGADEPCEDIPEALPLQAIIRDWAAHWHLAESWVREVAIATLEGWASEMPLDDWWPPPLRGGAGVEPESFTVKGWKPSGQHWEQWEQDFFKHLRRNLDDYRWRQVRRVREAGMVPSRAILGCHFEWPSVDTQNRPMIDT